MSLKAFTFSLLLVASHATNITIKQSLMQLPTSSSFSSPVIGVYDESTLFIIPPDETNTVYYISPEYSFTSYAVKQTKDELGFQLLKSQPDFWSAPINCNNISNPCYGQYKNRLLIVQQIESNPYSLYVLQWRMAFKDFKSGADYNYTYDYDSSDGHLHIMCVYIIRDTKLVTMGKHENHMDNTNYDLYGYSFSPYQGQWNIDSNSLFGLHAYKWTDFYTYRTGIACAHIDDQIYIIGGRIYDDPNETEVSFGDRCPDDGGECVYMV